jgi:nucleotide-binding universal stress UspA family protein
MELNDKYRKVLVPVDGSDSSFHALEQAFQFSSPEKNWVTVACVAPYYQGDLDTLVFADPIVAKMRQPCENALTKAKEIAASKGYSIDTVLLEEGEPSSRLVEFADANNRAMIIIGRRGLSNLKRVFVGSITKRVIGHSHGDVVVVPDGTTLAWDKILVATDGSPCSQAAVERAVHFAKVYGSTIDVVSVVDVPDSLYGEAPDLTEVFEGMSMGYADTAVQYAKSQGLAATPHVITGTPYEIIPDLAKSLGTGIIIVGSHGRTGMNRLLMGSVAEKIIGLASCPVLVARDLVSSSGKG